MDDDGKNSVLIVDDDYFDLEILKNILEPEYAVYITKSGRDGLNMAVELSPDVILLDIIIPDISGFDILSLLKKNELTRKIPVIIVTGLEDGEGEERGLYLEAADYIHKPFNEKNVKLRVQNQMQIVNHMSELIVLQKRLETAVNAAENANKAKSSFLARMSHEIRTPLNAVLGISEIQLQNQTLAHDVKEAFVRIFNSGDLLLGIINDILDISKIEAGKLELVREQYYLSSMINDTVYLNIIKYEDKGIEFILNIDENVPSLLIGDEIRIKQILNNLLSNAFKYTASGEVELSLKTESREDNRDLIDLIFRVRDTGQGMNAEQLEKLFDEYARFNLETNRTTVGTGLGMGITQNLISMMNGEIKAESEKGRGSVFTVCLPQGNVNAPPLGKESVEKLKQFRSSFEAKMKNAPITRELIPFGRILIVDDNDMNLYVTRGMLTPYGLQVDTALSGAEGIKKIKSLAESGSVYDIIFMDHMMPVMNGIEAVKIIRELGSKYKELPVIALTANAVAGMKNMFLENGFSDFLSKPVNMKELDEILKKWISPDKIIKSEKSGKREDDKQEESEKFINILSGIEEINIETGLSYISGGKDAYKNTLEIFYEKLVSECDNMSSFLKAKDISSFLVSIHAMKSMLAIIGATALSGKAYELEIASSNQDIAFCTRGFGEFKNELLILHKKLSSIYAGASALSGRENGKIKETKKTSPQNTGEKKLLKTLLVEDTEMILLIVKEKLIRCGLQVDTAVNGLQAVDKIMNNTYDIVFMDYLMPEMNGVDAAVCVRKWENEKNIKKNIIIALTANEDAGNKEMFLKSGFNDFMSKPVVAEDLEKIIKKWIPS